MIAQPAPVFTAVCMPTAGSVPVGVCWQQFLSWTATRFRKDLTSCREPVWLVGVLGCNSSLHFIIAWAVPFRRGSFMFACLHTAHACILLCCLGGCCRYVEAEILNHRMLRHPHVIEFREVFITSEYICIAMEFASGGSLFT